MFKRTETQKNAKLAPPFEMCSCFFLAEKEKVRFQIKHKH